MNAAVFLDRDGVLNEVRMQGSVAASPRSLTELIVVPGAVDATVALHRLGFCLVVVTNQPDIGRGTLSHDDVAAMHDVLVGIMPIARFEVCPHPASVRCSCRKPAPGMILSAAAELDIDLARSWTVGDRWVDISAGSSAGTRTALVERPYSWSTTSSGDPPGDLCADLTVADLASFAAIVGAAKGA